MGLATTDRHNQKEHTEINKILKLVLIGLVLTEIQTFKNLKNLQRNVCKLNPDKICPDLSGFPYISL